MSDETPPPPPTETQPPPPIPSPTTTITGDKPQDKAPTAAATPPAAGGGGWGGWGLSPLSLFSEISRNAVEVAKSAIADIQPPEADSRNASAAAGGEGEEEGGEKEELRKSALDKLEKAGEDSILGQGLKVIDSSVESLTTGTWQALGSAWKGGSFLVQKLESSASSLAETIQQGNLPAKASSIAPSIIETGKLFTVKGMEVLERVGKETMELIIEETGLEVDKNTDEVDQQTEEEQFEEVSFDRCFYIYGGPDQLEELEALSSHYALLLNRKKAKLVAEQKSFYDGKLRAIQQIFNLSTDIEEDGPDSDKGKKIKAADTDGDAEMKKLCDSSVSRAAKMAAGFTTALGGLAPNEIIRRTTNSLETIHSEGVHRLSELCCLAVSQLLILSKSVISAANKSKTEEADEEDLKIDWPEDPVLKAKIIRWKAQSISGDIEKVSSSFATGISDVAEAYAAAIQNSLSGKQDVLADQKSMQEKAKSISDHLHADQSSAVSKLQDALQYLAYVVLCTSMPSV